MLSKWNRCELDLESCMKKCYLFLYNIKFFLYNEFFIALNIFYIYSNDNELRHLLWLYVTRCLVWSFRKLLASWLGLSYLLWQVHTTLSTLRFLLLLLRTNIWFLFVSDLIIYIKELQLYFWEINIIFATKFNSLYKKKNKILN